MRTGAKVKEDEASSLRLDVERVSLEACIAEVELLVRRAWKSGVVSLDVELGSDLPAVKCDALALQSAILNLLANARDAMPDGGGVSVRAGAVLLDSGASGIELHVADSGVGMKPDTIIRAFEPFFTTKPDGLGGAGLPIVERFVRETGGRVRIESEYGVGTTVALLLPAER